MYVISGVKIAKVDTFSVTSEVLVQRKFYLFHIELPQTLACDQRRGLLIAFPNEKKDNIS